MEHKDIIRNSLTSTVSGPITTPKFVNLNEIKYQYIKSSYFFYFRQNVQLMYRSIRLSRANVTKYEFKSVWRNTLTFKVAYLILQKKYFLHISLHMWNKERHLFLWVGIAEPRNKQKYEVKRNITCSYVHILRKRTSYQTDTMSGRKWLSSSKWPISN